MHTKPTITIWSFFIKGEKDYVWKWTFERHQNADEVCICSWREGAILSTRSMQYLPLATARAIWNQLVQDGGTLYDTKVIG
jgi:hypothetical protein